MPLHIHRSTNPDTLAAEAARLLAEPPADPLALDRIAVHSRGVEQWLAMRIAGHNGIFGAATFFRPDDLTAQLAADALGEPLPATWTPGELLWAMLAELPPLLPQLDAVRDYVDAEGPSERPLRLVTLAQRLAPVFATYGSYRPDLVHSWQHPADDEPWEAPLWRAVEARLGATHLTAWDTRLAARTLPARHGRILFFTVTTLPPLALHLLADLAGDQPIHLFALHPSPASWGRDRPHHPLLVGMGTLACDFRTFACASRAVHHLLDAAPPPRDTLLHAVQADLHDDVVRPHAPTASDDSLQLHLATSPLRQVQVLRDTLLHLLDDPTLQPRDIVVMSPDVETFAPLVQAVFADGAPRWDDHDAHPAGFPALPFRLADRGVRSQNEAADALLTLLELAGSRLEAPDVFAFLTHRPVRERFGLSADDLPRVQELLAESGARWGIDAAHRVAEGLPADDRFTWRFALDRLLLGQALAAPDDVLVLGHAPSCDVEALDDRRVLGSLVDALETLLEEVRALQAPRPPADWFRELGRAATHLLDDPERPWQLLQVTAGLDELHHQAEASGFAESIDLRTLRALVAGRFDAQEPGQGFLAGAITVCQLVPLRSIPFRVVCLLGIDDGVFPRTQARPGYDRMALDRHPGDRDASIDDRALFLEAIQSARDTLVITCTGRSERTGRDLPLAVPVAELLDVVRSMTDDPTVDRIQHRHALQPWSPEHFTAPAHSHDRRMLAAAQAWRDGHAAPKELPRRFTGPLPGEPDIPDEVSLDVFVRFWRHPPSELVRRRLGLSLHQDDVELTAEIPLGLDGLQQWILRKALLDDHADVPYADRALRGGLLPLGAPGAVALEDQQQRVQAFLAGVRPLRADPGPPVDVHLPGAPILSGRLHDLCAGGRVVLQPGRVKPKGLFQLWIEHLALHAAGWSGPSTLLGPGGGKRLAPLSVEQATEWLDQLRSGYRLGLAKPLLFWPDVSHDAHRSGDREQARRACKDAWIHRSDAVRTVDRWILGPGAHPFDPDVAVPGLADPWKVANVWKHVLAHLEGVSL